MLEYSAARIRPVTSGEYEAEARLVRESYAAGPYADELAGDPMWARVETDTAGRDQGGSVLVAERAGALAGSVSVLRGGTRYAKLARPGEAELRLLAVSPAARGRHLGELLVRAGLEEALRWGVNVVRLDTGVRNPVARLYERIGFERTPDLDTRLAEAAYGESLTFSYLLQGSREVRVREVREAEIARVSELVLAAYRDNYPQLDAGYLQTVADVATRAEHGLVWVAEDVGAGEILGTVTTPRGTELLTEVSRPGEMDIRFLGVAAVARGRGVGELLTRHCVKLGEIRGLDQLVLETSPEMEAAWRLYERLGFSRLPERERVIERESGARLRLLTYGHKLPGRAKPCRVESQGGTPVQGDISKEHLNIR